MPTKQELEEQKLALEIAALRRPHSRNPTFWISVITAMVAVAGVFAQSYISKYEVAKADFTVAKSQADAASAVDLRDNAGRELKQIQAAEAAASQQVADANVQLANIQDRFSHLLAAIDKDPRPATSELKDATRTATNAYYAVGVYSLDAPPQIMKTFVASLQQAGYSVIKAQTLTQREPWLSTHTAVLYYDDAAKAKAQWIASQLQAAGAANVAVDKGSGTGIPAARAATSFRVHIIG